MKTTPLLATLKRISELAETIRPTEEQDTELHEEIGSIIAHADEAAAMVSEREQDAVSHRARIAFEQSLADGTL